MHRTRASFSIALIGALAAWAFAGCSQSTGTDASNDVSTRTQTVNLNDPYGGFNTADEQPAFGDQFLLANYGPDANLTVGTAEADTVRPDPTRVHRYLMVTWGNLRADSLVTFSTDWSGSLCAENGAVQMVRTIRFDPADHLLPRTSRQCVEWVSHTKPHFDGILVSLFHAPCDSLAGVTTAGGMPDSLCGDPLSVTFTTGPLTVTFSQAELANLHKVIPVDEFGNAVAFNSIVLMPHECPHGFMAGQWKPVADKQYAGIFRGEWMSENGLHAGFLRGIYGQNRRGDNVFFAKWITDSGAFHGIMKGSYGTNPAATADMADGWYDGVWVSRQLQIAGGVHGVWGHGNTDTEGGFFRGVWGARCRP
ncbi:MAG TPA: hypothetical protein VFH88_03130 [Candidatus Krumholzibacteria bacterium]|nr:hypothetical protein [Candidatus Krumholzibacteria bacterium]